MRNSRSRQSARTGRSLPVPPKKNWVVYHRDGSFSWFDRRAGGWVRRQTVVYWYELLLWPREEIARLLHRIARQVGKTGSMQWRMREGVNLRVRRKGSQCGSAHQGQ